jgi:hypothetical protein
MRTHTLSIIQRAVLACMIVLTGVGCASAGGASGEGARGATTDASASTVASTTATADTVTLGVPIKVATVTVAQPRGIPGAAPERPRPYPVFETTEFSRAVSRGTRTRTGTPGPDYWQQRASYVIEAKLDTATKRLTGHETVSYVNMSPDTLRRVAVYLRQNIYAPGAPRTVPLPVTGGVELARVAVDGRVLSGATRVEGVSATLAGSAPAPPDSAGYTLEGTVAWIRLPRPLAPKGDSVELSFDWSFTPPPAPADGREGQDGEVYFIGYWYPQLAVYDDVDGWVTDPYLGTGEFYMGYGDYDVRVNVPEGWIVGASGELANADSVLSPSVRERLAMARKVDSVVHVVPAAERGTSRATLEGRDGTLTWHFTANSVRDFAWATSARYLWDATRAIVGGEGSDGRVGRVGNAGSTGSDASDGRPGRSGPDTVDIYTFYRDTPQAVAWKSGARYTRAAIEFLSGYLWPYPYPQMTSVEGILDGGGMEYPMLTVIQSYADTMRLAGNLMHEVGHMWFPMQVGSNEQRVPWQDEGLTQFNSGQGTKARYGVDREGPAREAYFGIVREGREVSLMCPADLYGDVDAYFALPYMKTTTVLVALRSILGDSLFLEAYREYGKRWQWKHPKPYDFFNAFDDVSGQDLSWFWRSWFYETWTLDQAIAGVRDAGDSAFIDIEDCGLVPMPVRVAITRADSTVQEITVPVDAWLSGAKRLTLRILSRPTVTRVEIDAAAAFPDIDRSNQTWRRGGKASRDSLRPTIHE